VFQTKGVEKIKTHILCSINFFVENLTVYEILRKNIVEPHRPQMTIRQMQFACWVTKATNTHSECVILVNFSLKQYLHECASVASMLRYTYIVCFVPFIVAILSD